MRRREPTVQIRFPIGSLIFKWLHFLLANNVCEKPFVYLFITIKIILQTQTQLAIYDNIIL